MTETTLKNTTEVDLWNDQEFLSSEEIQRRVRELGPLLSADADAVNDGSRLTDAVKSAFVEAGLFRMGFPRAWGGPQMRVDDQIALIEFIASHDASIAWNAMILVDGGVYASQLNDPETAHELYPTMDLATSATSFPLGKAEEVADGYRITGRWSFGSGISNADRSVCSVNRYDAAGNVEHGDDGEPIVFEVWVPRDRIVVHDTWYTTGLQGTGSADFSIEGEVIVPPRHMMAHLTKPRLDLPPLGRYPTLLAANQLGVSLGLAKHAIAEFTKFIEKSRNTSTKAAKSEPTTLAALGEAQAHYRAARALALTTFGDATDSLFADRPLTSEQQGSMAGALVLTARMSRDAIEIVMEAAGSRGVLAVNPFDRIYRDMSTAVRHLLHRKAFYEVSGRRYLQNEAETIGIP